MSHYGGFGGVDTMATTFFVLFIIMFLIVISVFISVAVRGARRYSKNESSPILTVEAKVVGKRESLTRHMDGTGDHFHNNTRISYYVTFEVASGDRLEFNMPGEEYGILVEGDNGRLTFQGTRYQGFDRMRDKA